MIFNQHALTCYLKYSSKIMKYVALLRGINVGGNHTVPMTKLKAFFESFSCTNVKTYINSGNVIFDSAQSLKSLYAELEDGLKKEFGFAIPLLIKTRAEMQKIAAAIPKTWLNDEEQRTDVAYLFALIDTKATVALLPIKKEYVTIKYVKGAIAWNVRRSNVNKSQLVKLISSALYKSMTVRNVNTARYLAEK